MTNYVRDILITNTGIFRSHPRFQASRFGLELPIGLESGLGFIRLFTTRDTGSPSLHAGLCELALVCLTGQMRREKCETQGLKPGDGPLKVPVVLI